MSRVVAVIFHQPPSGDAGPLTTALAALRALNGRRQLDGFTKAGADARLVDDLLGESTIGAAIRRVAASARAAGVIVLGSGAVPLATAADRRAFVAAAAGPPGGALANNRFSADIVALAGSDRLSALPELASDNGLPRWHNLYVRYTDELNRLLAS